MDLALETNIENVKCRVNRQEFISVLTDYSSILKDNPNRPILSALYMQAEGEKILFMGCNPQIEYKKTIGAEVSGKGNIVFKPALILEYIKLLEGEEITLEQNASSLIIENAEFSILDSSNYPLIVESAAMTLSELAGKDFVQALDTVKFAAAISPDNLALNCVRINFQKEKTSFVTTDQHRLLYLEKDFPSLFEKEISLPLEAVQVIIKLLKEEEESIRIGLSGDNLLLEWKDSYYSCKLTAMPYPNYRAILSNNFFDKKMEFHLADFKTAMKRVITVAKSSMEAKFGGTFNFKGKQVLVKAFSGKAKMQQKIPMMKQGEDFVSSLNCKYIVDFLEILSKNVLIQAKNSSSMFKFTEEGNPSLIYILMPLALRDSE